MIRFGFCGVGGFVEKAVLPMMSRVREASLHAVFSPDEAKRERLAHTFGFSKTYATYDEMLDDPDIDAVYIASPNVFHKEQTIAAAKKGKHVFCEKPMALHAADCDEMARVCRDNGVQLGIGFCYRFQGAQEKVKNLIAEKAIGEVSFLHFSFNLGGYNPETAGWRCDPKLSGGGPLMDLAPHLIDLARYFTGDEVDAVMAFVRPDRDDRHIELDAHALLEMRGGTRVLLDTSFVRNNLHQYTVVGTDGQLRAEGTMCWNNEIPEIGKGKLYVEKFTDRSEIAFETEEHIEKQFRLYCQALNRDEPVPVSGKDGRIAQRVIDAIYASGRTGARVKIGYDGLQG